MLYNDAFIPTLGAKHPRALGGLLSDEFAEVWDEVGRCSSRCSPAARPCGPRTCHS